jgi:glucose/arabinose dehydrogenase
LVLGLLALLAPTGSGAAVTLPPGFSDELVVSGLTGPTALAFLPDGRILVAQKEGVVRIVPRRAARTGRPREDDRPRP